MNTKNKYSILIPIYNEEESITELSRRIIKTIGRFKKSYEIIFIDDGSTDNSLKIIQRLHKKNNLIKAISLRKNSGKSIAMSSGFNAVSGEIIITIDGDLQDQPEEIPKLIHKLNEGFDLVSGWKKKRMDNYFTVLMSRIFNYFVSKITQVKIHDVNCGFKAYRVKVIKNLNIYGDLFRFIPALAHWQGFKVGEVIVDHKARPYGQSKFKKAKMVRGFFDLFTIIFLLKYLKRPLHFFGSIGMLLLTAGFIINLFLSVLWFQGMTLYNRPLLILGILLMITGLQLITTGLIGEMIAHLLDKIDKNYPISKKIGLS